MAVITVMKMMMAIMAMMMEAMMMAMMIVMMKETFVTPMRKNVPVRHSTASFDEISETCGQGKPIVVTYAVMSCDRVRACEVCIAVDIHPELVTTAHLLPFNPRR